MSKSWEDILKERENTCKLLVLTYHHILDWDGKIHAPEETNCRVWNETNDNFWNFGYTRSKNVTVDIVIIPHIEMVPIEKLDTLMNLAITWYSNDLKRIILVVGGWRPIYYIRKFCPLLSLDMEFIPSKELITKT